MSSSTYARRPRLALGLLALGLTAWACDSTSPKDPGPRPPADLNIVTLAPTAPLLQTDSVSFYALFDEDRRAHIDFVGGESYLEFRVDKLSLLKRPDGSLFKQGDSILITIKVVNPDSLYFDFQPSGLVFNPAKPARLHIEYQHAGTDEEGDFNDDGVVDSKDHTIESSFSIWRQENPTSDFLPATTILEVDLDEVEAEITGFSRYALAY